MEGKIWEIKNMSETSEKNETNNKTDNNKTDIENNPNTETGNEVVLEDKDKLLKNLEEYIDDIPISI